jgi:hypothetical protein
VAILAGVAKMITPGRANMTFAGFRAHQSFPAVGEALVLDRGEGALRQQARQNARDYENGFFHDPPLCKRRVDPATS